jgi:hypothetical protein
VHGTVNPNGGRTTYHFAYGPTTAYGNRSPIESAGAGITPVNVSATLSGLRWDTTYHYRLVATNPLGRSEGADETFHTPDPRLGGRFRVRVRVTRGGYAFGEHRGQRFVRIYRFKPHCDAGSCTGAGLRREGHHGVFHASLHRVNPGLYQGTESFSGGWCQDGLRFSTSGHMRIKIKRAPVRAAKKIAGRLRLSPRGCLEGHESARLRGRPG